MGTRPGLYLYASRIIRAPKIIDIEKGIHTRCSDGYATLNIW